MADQKPKERKKIIHTREVTMNLPVVRAPKWLQGFVDFIREQGVVGIAVGLIVGLGAKTLVDSFVINFINPLIGFAAGGTVLSAKYVCLNYEGTECSIKIGYGKFLNDLISFLIIVFIVYFVVKILKLEKLDKKEG